MNPSEEAVGCLRPKAIPRGRLTDAFRGGALMIAVSMLWGGLLRHREGPSLDFVFLWLPSAWITFPLGALLGYRLPQWVAGRRWPATAGIGILAGLAGGFAVAGGFWLVAGHIDLIGLVANRNGGGYESYSHSVRLQLYEKARQALSVIVPVMAAWIVGWTLWVRCTGGPGATRPVALNEGSEIPCCTLRFDLRLLQLVGWIAVGLGLFASCTLLLTSLTVGGSRVEFSKLLVVGPGAVGLVFLGPFFGPLVTGWDYSWAWKYAAVAVPVLAGSLAPFGLFRNPVQPGTAAIVWCGFVSSLLLWIATGIYSLGRCIG